MTVVASGRAALFNMYYGKSAVPVLILSQEASRQLTWWQGTITCKLILWAIYKNLGGAWQTRLVILCACFYKNTWQKSQTKISLKACTEDAWYRWHLNCLCKNLEVCGKDICSMEAYYRELRYSETWGPPCPALSNVCIAVLREAEKVEEEWSPHFVNVVVFHSH